MKWIQVALLAVVSAAAVASVSIALATLDGGADWGPLDVFFLVVLFLLSPVVPYVYLGVQGLCAKSVVQAAIVLCASISIAIYGVVTLASRLSPPDDALSGLWLLFIPFYQLLACGVVHVIVLCLGRRGPITGPPPGAEGAKHDRLPWYRRSSVMSKLAIAGLVFLPAVIPVCIAVLTGPIYYDRDGARREWSSANKIAALLILAVGGYTYAAALLR